MPLKYVFLIGVEHPIQIPDTAPEHTCATWSLVESKISFLTFSEWLSSSLPISLTGKGGVYHDTVSSSWGIPKLVSAGSGRPYKKRDFVVHDLFPTFFSVCFWLFQKQDETVQMVLSIWQRLDIFTFMKCSVDVPNLKYSKILEEMKCTYLQPYYLRLKRD